MKLLIAEDEITILQTVETVFLHEGFSVDTAQNGAEALAALRQHRYDCVILDIMMPELDGLSVLRQARREGLCAPVLMLTARSEPEDCVTGLDAGADDYLTKPFLCRELLARVHALLRRSREPPHEVLTLGDLQLDCATHIVRGPAGEELLSRKAFCCLEFLARHPRTVFTDDQLLHSALAEQDRTAGSLWLCIFELRRKLKRLGADTTLLSLPEGYRLEPAAEAGEPPLPNGADTETICSGE